MSKYYAILTWNSRHFFGGKHVVSLTKQLQGLFCKVNESQTEEVIIKKSRAQNDNILFSVYTRVNISAITQCMNKDLKITKLLQCLVKQLCMMELILKQLLVMSLILAIMIAIRTAVVHDKTGFVIISIFT